MSATRLGITCCPFCDRSVSHWNGSFGVHSITPKTDDRCPMSNQRVPDLALDEQAFETRARIVADLAEQVQDADPSVVWHYLTALPAAEVQRLAMVALAAIPVDRTVPEMFEWVGKLPVAAEVAS